MAAALSSLGEIDSACLQLATRPCLLEYRLSRLHPSEHVSTSLTLSTQQVYFSEDSKCMKHETLRAPSQVDTFLEIAVATILAETTIVRYRPPSLSILASTAISTHLVA